MSEVPPVTYAFPSVGRLNPVIWSRQVLPVVAIVGSVLLPASPVFADNPVVQTNYTSDPAPMVSNGRDYLITTHDENVAGQPCTAVAGYTLCQWFAYSSADMVNWTTTSLASLEPFSWASHAAWAPQVIPRNGKFYFYAPLNNTPARRSSGRRLKSPSVRTRTPSAGRWSPPVVEEGRATSIPRFSSTMTGKRTSILGEKCSRIREAELRT